MADILIRGMEMPQRCKACRFCGFGGRRSELNVCMFTGESQPKLSQERMSKCPLVPVPPHGRLIDADALDRAFTDQRFNSDGTLNHWGDRPGWCMHGYEVEKLIADAPTIVPAEGGGEDG